MLTHFETRTEKIVFIGLFVLFVLATMVSFASLASQIGRPAPGFVVWRNLVVPAIGTPSWPGSRAGIPLRSVVLSANGQPLADAVALRALVRALPVGTAVTYRFQRGAAVISATVPTTLLRWRDVIPVYAGYVIDGLAFFVTALIVFYFKPRLPAARASLALGTVLGMSLLLPLDAQSAFWVDRGVNFFEALMPGALLHFALCFPEEKAIVRRLPSLRWIVYLPFLGMGALQNWFLGHDAMAHLRVNDWVYTATAVAGIAVFASLIHSFLAAQTPRARQQAKTVLGGVTGAAFIPSLGLLSIILLGLQMPMNLLSPFFFIYPVSVAYAIARHDLFSVDRYLRLGVVYAALSVVIVVSYGAMLMAADAWTGGERLPSGLVPLYLFAVVVLFDPLRSRIQSLVDRLFYRQAYNYRSAVEATSRTLASVLDTERVASTLLTTLTEVMAIEWAVLYLFDSADTPSRTFALPRERADACLRLLPRDDGRLRRVTKRLGPLSRGDPAHALREERDADIAPFCELGASLVMPLRSRDEAIGIVLIGEKRSGAYFTDDDIDLLDTLLNQTALALANAHAYEVIRHTQADLIRAERMAAVGELASAVAHGIRNPLAGIRATAQVAREDVDEQARLARDLDNILGEADRLERRVRSILDLARPVELRLTPGDIGHFLTDFAQAMRTRLPAGVTLGIDVDPHLPAVAFDAPRLNEVVETIVVNAVEAMGTTGTIVITARANHGDGASSRVAVTIADSGPGIPPTALGRIFDLFYTTKPSGTGVGLAMAKRLLERQGASIDAHNAPAGGAVFEIRFGVGSPATQGSA